MAGVDKTDAIPNVSIIMILLITERTDVAKIIVETVIATVVPVTLLTPPTRLILVQSDARDCRRATQESHTVIKATVAPTSLLTPSNISLRDEGGTKTTM